MDRRALTKLGMQAAADLRDELDLDPFGPIDVYAAAAAMGVNVRFMGASMEGFYYKGPPSRILLSALRPLARRAFTCAHELGHHVFGHGSTIDELQEDERSDNSKPEEVLANAFAAFFLMPTVGLRGAFRRRGWDPETATPLQVFTIACQFGVGYRTLLNHLGYTLREISAACRAELERSTPQRIRRQLFPDEYDALLLIDPHNEAGTFDVEKGSAVLVPSSADVNGSALEHVRTVSGQELYRAAKRGVAQVTGAGVNSEVRVMPARYQGVAAYRFLEDPDEED